MISPGGGPGQATVDAYRNAVTAAYREFDVAMEDLVRAARVQGHSVPCREGCDHCCSDVAWTTEIEMGPAVERVRRMSPHRQNKILAAAAEWERRIRGKGIDPDMTSPDRDGATALRPVYYSAHAACPLLDRERHRCMVYEERPIACRGHWLIDEPASKCANVDKDPWTQNITNTEPLIAAVQAIYLSEPKWAFLPRVLQRMFGIAT
jgi:Fe-S-cluster containining protein